MGLWKKPTGVPPFIALPRELFLSGQFQTLYKRYPSVLAVLTLFYTRLWANKKAEAKKLRRPYKNDGEVSLPFPAAQPYLGGRSTLSWALDVLCACGFLVQTEIGGLPRRPSKYGTSTKWQKHSVEEIEEIIHAQEHKRRERQERNRLEKNGKHSGKYYIRSPLTGLMKRSKRSPNGPVSVLEGRLTGPVTVPG
jgi:hypothetical protein